MRAPLMCGLGAGYRCSAHTGNRVTVRRSKADRILKPLGRAAAKDG